MLFQIIYINTFINILFILYHSTNLDTLYLIKTTLKIINYLLYVILFIILYYLNIQNYQFEKLNFLILLCNINFISIITNRIKNFYSSQYKKLYKNNQRNNIYTQSNNKEEDNKEEDNKNNKEEDNKEEDNKNNKEEDNKEEDNKEEDNKQYVNQNNEYNDEYNSESDDDSYTLVGKSLARSIQKYLY